MDLRLARRIAGITQEELAKRSGVDVATISRLETGNRANRPSYTTIVRLSRSLNLAPDELFPIPLDLVDEAEDDEPAAAGGGRKRS